MEHIHVGPMAGRTVLVTEATSGIGRATALGLATMSAHLAITGRDRGRIEETRPARSVEPEAGTFEMFLADLSSQAQVRRLASEVLEALPRTHVLVNNAGGYWSSRRATADGLERTVALNHLAPFLLTNLLLDRLELNAPAGVVTVGSNAHARGALTSTTFRANCPTPAAGPTATPSSPTSCSAISRPDECARAR